ncbi:MAG: LacI family DNA-binding transcriptional regulator, partial [Shimia sp.]
MRRVTSRDVAERAGVSQSAVSRVFSGASASKVTADKVRAAAEELGYRPNVLARSLITGRSRIIGLVVAYLENPFYPDAIQHLSVALQERGHHLLIFTASWASDVDAVVQDLMDYQVDGIVAASVAISDGLVDRCRATGIPVVLFNRGQPDGALPQVTSDNRAGAAKVAAHLAETGHRRIAHIAGWEGSLTGRDRAEAFAETLARHGLDVETRAGDYLHDRAGDAARDLWATHRPDAIFVANDHMAFAAMDALRGLGVDVPGECSIVGYDDVPMAAWGAYDLTTVRQPTRDMVDRTVDLLFARLD